jgi:putative peptide zinc metalloprotease protein
MNIVEALNVALPELPPETGRLLRPPRVDPALVVREQLEKGERKVLLLVPSISRFFVFTPDQWTLLQLFDGERSYEEISQLFQARTGRAYPPEWVQQFAEGSQDAEFWYRTAEEKNRALWQKLKDERRQRIKNKSKYGNLSEISFSAWDPDRFLTTLNRKLSFLFTPWFLVLNLTAFVFMAYVLGSHWGEIVRDNIELYNFTDKGAGALAQFWIIVFVIGFVHELAHGLLCKHAGGAVHRLGFLLIYLSPAFFCDTTEVWVYGGKWQRILTSTAGIWSSLIICALSSMVWWGTPPGSEVHNFAYLIILFSGFLPVLINLNPLVKLDGYFIFTEMFALGELKENSAAYVSSWIKRHIFGLPVVVPHVTGRRKLLYVPYTFFSAVYSYGLLFFVVTFTYHVCRRFSPEWGFVPALLLAWAIFKGRIVALVSFMKRVYLDKKDRLQNWLSLPRSAALAVGVLVVLLAPLWRENVQARFLLEPARRAVVRAEVPGVVIATDVQEGQAVAAGAPLLQLRNLSLESAAAQAESDAQLAAARALQAEQHYQNYGAARRERDQRAEQSRILQVKLAHLNLNSPIPGVVVTPRVQDLFGAHLQAGAPAVEIADLSSLRARSFVSELAVREIHPGSPADLLLDDGSRITGLRLASLAAASSNLEPGLMESEAYKGMQGAQFYALTILVPNNGGRLRQGITGTAKIYLRRRSLAGLAAQAIYDFACRKIW